MSTLIKNSLKKEVVKDSDTKNAEALIRQYKQKRWVANSERIGKPDSLSAWYSIEELENFLTLAKDNGGDGIKLYFGSYPEDYKPKPEYAGRQTLVLVATKSKVTVTGATANKDIYVTQEGQVKILCTKDPTMCPPYCHSNSEGGMGDLGITIVDRGMDGMAIV